MNEEKKSTLLIVDDESSNLKVLSYILGSEYTIYTAVSGASAIEKAKEALPDLILLDIVMPEMDGFETLGELKKIPELQKTPIIFITGLDSDEHETKGLALEAADYIIKPFNPTVVKLRVRNQLQLQSALKAAESANRSKSSFLAKMSHEIRTPLNAILGISLIQLQNESYPREVTEAFARIFNSGDLLLGIINDILDISKIEAGKVEFTNIQYDVANMINDSVYINMIKYKNKPIDFILNVSENVPSALIGDEVRIQQILNNLITNAYKFTVSGKIELSISVEKPKQDSENTVIVIFSVSDTGQGMTEKQIKQIFENFSGFDPEISKTIAGTGLGMSITKSLVHLMNGQIFADSFPGSGTKFTIRLPQGITGAPPLGSEMVGRMCQFCSNIEAKSKKMHVIRHEVPRGKVLIVDDVDINLYVAKEMLTPYGLEIDLASSGEEALEKVQAKKYDLIFMDHIMPIMDGVETTKRIRELGGAHKKMPIIALTANAVLGVKEMFLENGLNGFVSKPIDLHELNDVLKEWMPSR